MKLPDLIKNFIFYYLITLISLGFHNSAWAIQNNTNQVIIQERLNELALFLGTTKFLGSEIIENEIPEPYHFLLTQPLMTLGIEKYYQRLPTIQLIHSEMDQGNSTYSRAIVMMVNRHQSKTQHYQKDEKIIVAVAFIKINFKELPPQAISSVEHANIPFGKILINNKINAISKGRAYFLLQCDSVLKNILNCKKNKAIYGRINTLINEDNKQWLAQVIEILPDLKCNNTQCNYIIGNQ